VEQLGLRTGSGILDIGCGRGHLLYLILSHYNVGGVGIDSSAYAIAEAERSTAAFVAAGRLTLVERAFEKNDYEAASFDLIACIGSTHAAGGYRGVLKTARRLLRAGGMLLVGEGYWKRPPSAEYLAFLQATADEHGTHQDNQTTGADEGFELLTCSECSQEEWDAYEEQYALNVEAYVHANPHDPEADAMLQRIRPWREAYLSWGRDTLGFGLYLFRLPSQ
jgi:cyclopropane fatty-acyl-phospholipid synthase-like methyltransferase